MGGAGLDAGRAGLHVGRAGVAERARWVLSFARGSLGREGHSASFRVPQSTITHPVSLCALYGLPTAANGRAGVIQENKLTERILSPTTRLCDRSDDLRVSLDTRTRNCEKQRNALHFPNSLYFSLQLR